jgi:hypothetical protein
MYRNNVMETGNIFKTNVSHLGNLSSSDTTGWVNFENRKKKKRLIVIPIGLLIV